MSRLRDLIELANDESVRFARIRDALEDLEDGDLEVIELLLGNGAPVVEAVPDPAELARFARQVVGGDVPPEADTPEPPAGADPPRSDPPATSAPSTPPNGDLSPRQAQFLAKLREAPGLSAAAYARRLDPSPNGATLSKIVYALQALGLIQIEGRGSRRTLWPVGAKPLSEGEAAKRAFSNGPVAQEAARDAAKPPPVKGPKGKEDAVPRTGLETRVVDAFRELDKPLTVGEVEDALKDRGLGIIVGGLARRGALVRVEAPGVPMFELASHLERDE